MHTNAATELCRLINPNLALEFGVRRVQKGFFKTTFCQNTKEFQGRRLYYICFWAPIRTIIILKCGSLVGQTNKIDVFLKYPAMFLFRMSLTSAPRPGMN